MAIIINFLKDQSSKGGFKNWLIVYFLGLISLYSTFVGYFLVFLLLWEVVEAGLIDTKYKKSIRSPDHHMNFWCDMLLGSGLVMLFFCNNFYLLAGACAITTISDLTRNDRPDKLYRPAYPVNFSEN